MKWTFISNLSRLKTPIEFDSWQIDFQLKNQASITSWLVTVSEREGKTIQKIRYCFCSDEFLLDINQRYLKHDYLTDIITFPYEYDPISSEIYISVERVRENASLHQESFDRELLRVLVHGLLHMCGYSDHSPEEKENMRAVENKYISLFNL